MKLEEEVAEELTHGTMAESDANITTQNAPKTLNPISCPG